MKTNVASAANTLVVVVVVAVVFLYFQRSGFCHAPVVNFYDLKVM